MSGLISGVRIPLTKSRYSIAVQWDCLDGKGIDLDLQAVIVDDHGLVVDAAYYNNLSAVNGAVMLSGDETSGKATGFDESLWVNFSTMPHHIKLIAFVVAVHGNGHLRDVDDGMLTVLEDGRALKEFKLERSGGDCDLVAYMRKVESGWELIQVEAPAELGSHFLDILEPNIGDLVRREIPHAPAYLSVHFEMEKGAIVPLPQQSTVKRVFVGIGGALPARSSKDIDIDISAVLVSSTGKVIGAVDGDHDSLYGISHSGNVVAGEQKAGDDEAISIDLAQVPPSVRAIYLVLSISNGCFREVEHAYARIIDQAGEQLVRYNIDGETGGAHTGLIIAKLLRSPGRRWGFMAIGAYYDAAFQTWSGAQPLIEDLFRASEAHHDTPMRECHTEPAPVTVKEKSTKEGPAKEEHSNEVVARLSTGLAPGVLDPGSLDPPTSSLRPDQDRALVRHTAVVSKSKSYERLPIRIFSKLVDGRPPLGGSSPAFGGSPLALGGSSPDRSPVDGSPAASPTTRKNTAVSNGRGKMRLKTSSSPIGKGDQVEWGDEGADEPSRRCCAPCRLGPSLPLLSFCQGALPPKQA